jgi:serine/threonine protein kinase
MTPKKIGRYDVEKELGRGGMAVVYLGIDPFVKRQVAIKLLPKQFIADPNFRARFQREAQVIASLDHPNIVTIFDFGEHEEQPFIVMRYMPGGTLGERLRREGSLSADESARILTQIGAALDEAHSKGIVHRDLKPGNILFDHRGDAAIADFGIVKLAESSNTLTGTGMIGTPGYMSPEQARGDADIDRRSDIYALGAILFEMLTGQLPYQADTPMGIAIKHVIDDVPRILTVKPDLPPAVDGVIVKAMAKERNGRYSSASELANTITSVATAATQQAARAVDMTRIEQAPKRSTPPPPVQTRRPAPPQPIPTQNVRRQTAAPPGAFDQPAPRPRHTPNPPAAQPQSGGRKIPSWLWIAGGLFILLLCIGGAAGGFGLINSLSDNNDATPTPEEAVTVDAPATLPVIADASPEGEENDPLAAAKASTVQVTGRGPQYLEQLIGSGSGFVFNDNGLVLTNYHLVEGATSIEIVGSDGRTTTAAIVGTSPCDDLAVLRLDGPAFPAGPLPTDPAAVPDLSAVSAAILGYPKGTNEQTTITGQISPAGQLSAAEWGNFSNAIYFNGLVNPGQSGAPLVAEDGAIIGIATIGLEPDDTVTVVPLSTIRPRLRELEQENNLNWIGLNIGPLPDNAPVAAEEGLFVFAVATNSPAAQTGIEAGDFLIGVGNSAIGSNDTDDDLGLYCRELRNFEAGDTLPISVLRGGERLNGEINGRPLGGSPEDTPTATPTTEASATLRPTNTATIEPTDTAVPPTNTSVPPTNTAVPPTQPPPTQPPPTQPPPTQPPPPPPTSPPPTSPPPPPATNTPEPP